MKNLVNRQAELMELDALYKKGGLAVLYGRRRVGKTRLLVEWISRNHGCYSQAIQAARDIQIIQTLADTESIFKTSIKPTDWSQFFELLDLQKKSLILCIDEFPYLVESDPSLPSIIQKWLDHRKDENIFLILSGSSQHMMHSLFLDRKSALFGRAQKLIHIEPMEFNHFCEFFNITHKTIETFMRFSLVGGIPRYWEFMDNANSLLDEANSLYFNFSAYLDSEPLRILSDEKIEGIMPINILETIGRGAVKPSEIAARIGTAQTNLSRPLQLLQDMSIIQRESCFGEPQRYQKKNIYKIIDPTLRFWFQVYSSHRSRWFTYSRNLQQKLIRDHGATIFEDTLRVSFPESRRYWEKNVEFDWIIQDGKQIEIYEAKFKALTNLEKAKVTDHVASQFEKSALSKEYCLSSIHVIDMKDYLDDLLIDRI